MLLGRVFRRAAFTSPLIFNQHIGRSFSAVAVPSLPSASITKRSFFWKKKDTSEETAKKESQKETSIKEAAEQPQKEVVEAERPKKQPSSAPAAISKSFEELYKDLDELKKYENPFKYSKKKQIQTRRNARTKAEAQHKHELIKVHCRLLNSAHTYEQLKIAVTEAKYFYMRPIESVKLSRKVGDRLIQASIRCGRPGAAFDYFVHQSNLIVPSHNWAMKALYATSQTRDRDKVARWYEKYSQFIEFTKRTKFRIALSLVAPKEILEKSEKAREIVKQREQKAKPAAQKENAPGDAQNQEKPAEQSAGEASQEEKETQKLPFVEKVAWKIFVRLERQTAREELKSTDASGTKPPSKVVLRHRLQYWQNILEKVEKDTEIVKLIEDRISKLQILSEPSNGNNKAEKVARAHEIPKQK